MSATYLCGALIEDDVDPEQARAIAAEYRRLQDQLDHTEMLRWKQEILARLGGPHSHPHMGFATYCHPSEHSMPRYHELAHQAGWTED